MLRVWRKRASTKLRMPLPLPTLLLFNLFLYDRTRYPQTIETNIMQKKERLNVFCTLEKLFFFGQRQFGCESFKDVTYTYILEVCLNIFLLDNKICGNKGGDWLLNKVKVLFQENIRNNLISFFDVLTQVIPWKQTHF